MQQSQRIEISLKPDQPDARGSALARDIEDLAIPGVREVRVVDVYWIEGDVTTDALETVARRLLYIAATPLIPFVRVTRIVRQLRYPGRPAHLIPRLVPLCLFLLTVEAIGACAGYIFGLGSSSLYIARIDFHRENFMNSQDRKHFAE